MTTPQIITGIARTTTIIPFTIDGYRALPEHYKLLIDAHMASGRPCNLPGIGEVVTRLVHFAAEIDGTLSRTQEGFALQCALPRATTAVTAIAELRRRLHEATTPKQ